MESQYCNNQSRKEPFITLINHLVQKFNPIQIHCFGENLSVIHNTGCFRQQYSTENYHYFLLMVTEADTRIEHQVQDFANNHFHNGKITILVHGRETICKALKANSKFFLTIFNHGQLIYAKDDLPQSVAFQTYIPIHAALEAQRHFDQRFLMATGFLASAKDCLLKENYSLCAFMAHQVIEQCCIALIRVHLAYRADIHNLYRLLSLCEVFSSAPSKLFLSGRNGDKRLLDIIVKSYLAARYKDDFQVSKTDAEQIFLTVSVFVKLTERMCVEEIASQTKSVP